MSEKRLSYGELMRENRQLRNALEALLEEMEQSEGVPTQTGKGPDRGVDTEQVRGRAPDPPGKRDPIKPPGQREDSPGNSGGGPPGNSGGDQS